MRISDWSSDVCSSDLSGQERRIVTRLDPTDEFYADGAAAGTVYISGNEAVVTVDADGVMRGVGAGTTTVTVINAFGEDRLEVHVEAPVVGDTVTIGSAGAIVPNSDGGQPALGPGDR